MIKLIKCDLYKIIHSQLGKLIGLTLAGFCGLMMLIFILADQVDEWQLRLYPLIHLNMLKSVIWPLFIILLSSLLVAQELEKKTILVYRVKGYSYEQIIISKIVTNIIVTIAMVMGTLLMAYICAIPIKLAGIKIWNGQDHILTKLLGDFKVFGLTTFAFIPLSILATIVCIEFKETIKSIIIAALVYFGLYIISIKYTNIGSYVFTYYIDAFFKIDRVTTESYQLGGMELIMGLFLIIAYSTIFAIYGIFRFSKKYGES